LTELLCRLTLVGAVMLMLPAAASAEIRLIAKTIIPGNATDLSRLDDGLGSDCNLFGGISGIAYTGKDNLYILLPDRGPNDGKTNYLCRFHTMKITVAGGTLMTSLQATTLLRDEMGRPLVGSLAALAPTAKLGARLDPEGVRVTSRGTICISDEYGPYVDEFDQQGKRLKRFPVPARYQVQHPDADPELERKRNTVGREPNRGMEGLALTPDGRKLVGIMQSPLLQEGGRKGTNVRILEIDVANHRTREFLYTLRDASTCVSEILAVNEHEFLVLERDGQKSKGPPFCKIFKIDLARATDIQQLAQLPVTGVPEGVAAVTKELFLDLHDARFGFKAGEMPVKVEGLAFGPDLPDGSRLLLVTTDNDFVVDQPTRLFAFAIDRADLPGWQGRATTQNVPR